MAKAIKTKRISIGTLEDIMKTNALPVQTVEWEGVEVTIKPVLSFKEMLTFADTVAKSCFTEDNVYLPEVKNFMIRCCTLEMYANFTLPDNLERRYDLVFNTDAYDLVSNSVSPREYSLLMDAIDEKIGNMAKANIESINQKLNEVTTSFEELQTQLNEVFSGVTSKDIFRLMDAITDGKLDEDKLVEAYIANGGTKAGDE